MAITFHCYDLEYRTYLTVTDIMVLIKEMTAGFFFGQGGVESGTRELAVSNAESRLPDEELFQRGMRFLKMTDFDGNSQVEKDEFCLYGQAALHDVLGLPELEE